MGTVTKRQTQVKKALRARGVTYGDVARLAGVSWSMVYQVLAGYKVSARVMAAVEKLLGENGRAA
jgi:hypothetical protein